jgi:PAS domain-containing protein
MDAPVARIVVNSRDVTERKLAEAALRQSEAQLREKATQLEQALLELQETQIQLIQTEKMSSLGTVGRRYCSRNQQSSLLHLRQYPPRDSIHSRPAAPR